MSTPRNRQGSLLIAASRAAIISRLRGSSVITTNMKKIIYYIKKIVRWTLSLALLTLLVAGAVWAYTSYQKGNTVTVSNVTEALPSVEEVKCDAECQYERMKQELIDTHYNSRIEAELRRAETTTKQMLQAEARVCALEKLNNLVGDDLRNYKTGTTSAKELSPNCRNDVTVTARVEQN